MERRERSWGKLYPWMLMGWLLAPLGGRAPRERWAVEAEAWEAPARMSVRELRALPGIGSARALRYARARWAARPQPPPALADLTGIGPATEAGVQAWCMQRGLEPP